MKKRAVLVMSYGTPAHADDVLAYYTHIRKGRPPSEQQLADLQERYAAIGGTFPLRANTDRQVIALQQALADARPEWDVVCVQGLKHATPFVEDGIAHLVDTGVTHAIGIVLAPHYSSMSVGTYIQRAQVAVQGHPLALRCVERYGTHPKLIGLLAARVQEQRTEDTHVVFTAHSLPARILERNDPYPDELLATARAIANVLQLKQWSFAWQSAGQTGEPWLGPDVLEHIDALYAQGVRSRILICPIGFVSDHLEVLYDLDQEAVAHGARLGIDVRRTRMLNDDALYMDVLTDVICAVADGFWT
jgi:ferrochelatase